MNNEVTIGNNIYIDPTVLRSKIELLRKEEEKMQSTFDAIKKDTLGMIHYWSGNTGEEAYNILNNYTRKFKVIIQEIESKIQFLESVLEAYSRMDELLNKKLEENANMAAY